MNPVRWPWQRTWSLHSLLVLLAAQVTLVAWIAGGALVWKIAEGHSEALHDEQLRHMAHLLMGLSGPELIEIGPNTPISARIANGQADGKDTLGEDYRYQLWSSDGRLLLTNFGLPSAAVMAKLGSSGYSWLNMDGERWRVYALVDDDAKQELQVAERAAVRQWLAGSVDGRLILMIALSLMVVLVPSLYLLRRLLRPLRGLAHQLTTRSASNLAPVVVAGAPSELQPIVTATNALFAHMSEALIRESSFTSVAAHELRTPLAALRVQAQVAAGTKDEEVRSRNLRDLVVSADRCAHLQDQLLTLTRLDAAKAADLGEELNLTELVMDAVTEIAPEARRRHVRLTTHSDGVLMTGHAFGIRTLLRNLLANAMRHVPEQGRIDVRVDAEAADVRLQIEDSGPGIPAASRERAFDRFERLNSNDGNGAGLGLSIVRSVVQAHAAVVELSQADLGGLRVTVCFGGRRVDLPADVDADDGVEHAEASAELQAPTRSG